MGPRRADLKSKRLCLIVADILLMTAVFSAAFFEEQMTALFPFCPLYRFTGVRCPSCGGTRAFYELVRLHPLRAFYYNPLLVLLGVWCFFLLALYHLKLFAGLALFDRIPKPAMLCCIAAAVFIFFIARNLSLIWPYIG